MNRLLYTILLLTFWLSSSAYRIDTLIIQSKYMDRDMTNLVVIPDNYDEANQEFPVLYLLHGAYGDYSDWVKKAPEVPAFSDQYNFIIVCPHGGYNTWYFDSPVDSSLKVESYISEEVINAVDSLYRTEKTPLGRGISGLSMGGHGAFYLAFKHQDIWGAAGSLSGGMDIRPFPLNWDMKARLGAYDTHKENWERNTVINMIYLLDGKKLKLILDCGTEDFFYGVNQRMHQKLLERNIPHDYIERPGKHNWDYWKNSIKYQMVFFDDFFNTKTEN